VPGARLPVEATAIEKSFSVTSIVLPDGVPPPPPAAAAAATVVDELPAPLLLPQALATSVTAPTSARIRAVRVSRRRVIRGVTRASDHRIYDAVTCPSILCGFSTSTGRWPTPRR